jgi:hypothetical protein
MEAPPIGEAGAGVKGWCKWRPHMPVTTTLSTGGGRGIKAALAVMAEMNWRSAVSTRW